MQETLRTDIYKDMKNYNWRLICDVEDNDFKPSVDKKMNSNQSYFIIGPGSSSSKTTLLKQLQEKLTNQDKNIFVFVLPI